MLFYPATHLRNGDTHQRLASGFGIGLATVHRHIREVVDLHGWR